MKINTGFQETTLDKKSGKIIIKNQKEVLLVDEKKVPLEIFNLIFKFLPSQELLNFCLTNRRFYPLYFNEMVKREHQKVDAVISRSLEALSLKCQDRNTEEKWVLDFKKFEKYMNNYLIEITEKRKYQKYSSFAELRLSIYAELVNYTFPEGLSWESFEYNNRGSSPFITILYKSELKRNISHQEDSFLEGFFHIAVKETQALKALIEYGMGLSSKRFAVFQRGTSRISFFDKKQVDETIVEISEFYQLIERVSQKFNKLYADKESVLSLDKAMRLLHWDESSREKNALQQVEIILDKIIAGSQAKFCRGLFDVTLNRDVETF